MEKLGEQSRIPRIIVKFKFKKLLFFLSILMKLSEKSKKKNVIRRIEIEW